MAVRTTVLPAFLHCCALPLSLSLSSSRPDLFDVAVGGRREDGKSPRDDDDDDERQ